jgi:hypothetical protein
MLRSITTRILLIIKSTTIPTTTAVNRRARSLSMHIRASLHCRRDALRLRLGQVSGSEMRVDAGLELGVGDAGGA